MRCLDLKAIFEHILGVDLGRIVICNCCVDSRKCQKNDVFFAMRGDNLDGHDFVSEAVKNGASLAIVERDIAEVDCDKYIVVDDVKAVIISITKQVLSLSSLRHRICITGSVGKTTTKYWLSEVLARKHDVFFPFGNLNTLYGNFLASMHLKKNADIGVFEVGSSCFGEIAIISETLQPTIAILLNIYDSHIGNYKNKEDLIREKLSIVHGLDDDGILIVDNTLKQFVHRKCITVGFESDSDIFVEDTCIRAFGFQYHIQNALYKHQMYIIGVIIAVIHCVGDDVSDYIETINNLTPVVGRGSVSKYSIDHKNITVVNDAYNASPTSMFTALQNTKCNIAIIGQMLELGEYELMYHEMLPQYLYKFNMIYFVGDRRLFNIFRCLENVKCFPNVDDDLRRCILSDISDGDSIFVKGSNSTGVWKIDAFLCSMDSKKRNFY